MRPLSATLDSTSPLVSRQKSKYAVFFLLVGSLTVARVMTSGHRVIPRCQPVYAEHNEEMGEPPILMCIGFIHRVYSLNTLIN